MEFEEYDIVKLYDKLDSKSVYVYIYKITGDVYSVKVLKQPSYNLISKKFSDSIFDQHCHQDDEVWDVPLNFDNVKCTFEVNKNMCQSLDRAELVILLKHLIYIDFTKDNVSKTVISSALDKFI